MTCITGDRRIRLEKSLGAVREACERGRGGAEAVLRGAAGYRRAKPAAEAALPSCWTLMVVLLYAWIRSDAR